MGGSGSTRTCSSLGAPECAGQPNCGPRLACASCPRAGAAAPSRGRSCISLCTHAIPPDRPHSSAHAPLPALLLSPKSVLRPQSMCTTTAYRLYSTGSVSRQSLAMWGPRSSCNPPGAGRAGGAGGTEQISRSAQGREGEMRDTAGREALWEALHGLVLQVLQGPQSAGSRQAHRGCFGQASTPCWRAPSQCGEPYPPTCSGKLSLLVILPKRPGAKRLRQICRQWGAASTRVLFSAATSDLQPSHLYLQGSNRRGLRARCWAGQAEQLSHLYLQARSVQLWQVCGQVGGPRKQTSKASK